MSKLKLLLHSCCAPCSGFLVSDLKDNFAVTVYFDNSNIYPREEFLKRKNEAKTFFKSQGVDFIETSYNHQKWLELIAGWENEPEKGQRCEICYRHRLKNTAKHAKKNDFDYFGTTLSISPHKDTKMINQIGKEVESKICHPELVSGSTRFRIKPGMTLKFLEKDFKKQDGFKKAMEFSHQHGFYHQNYCGCEYSIKKTRKQRNSSTVNLR